MSDNTLIATVVGTCRYKTSLTVKNGFLHGNCSCPLGDEGEFCKHLVATGLAFLNGEYITRECKKYFDWNTFIKRCSREVLEQIIFEMTPSCPDIIEEYRMKNLPDAPEKLIDELKQKFDSLTELAEECDCYDNYYDNENNYERFDKNFGQLKSGPACLR